MTWAALVEVLQTSRYAGTEELLQMFRDMGNPQALSSPTSNETSTNKANKKI